MAFRYGGVIRRQARRAAVAHAWISSSSISPPGYPRAAAGHGKNRSVWPKLWSRADNCRVSTSRVRVVLADDDVLLREGLASLLDRSGLEVVGQAGDADELIELVGKERPGLAVVDIRMPPEYSTEGLAAARVIQREFPQTAVVVLSAHVEVEHAMDLLANGHRTGYLLKSRVTDVAEFIDTLKRWSAAGRRWTRRWYRNWWRRGGLAIRWGR
jgi:CheY-like chemotaxis protein